MSVKYKYSGLTEDLFQRYRKEVEVLRATYPNSIVKHIMGIKGCTKKNPLLSIVLSIWSIWNTLF